MAVHSDKIKIVIKLFSIIQPLIKVYYFLQYNNIYLSFNLFFLDELVSEKLLMIMVVIYFKKKIL